MCEHVVVLSWSEASGDPSASGAARRQSLGAVDAKHTCGCVEERGGVREHFGPWRGMGIDISVYIPYFLGYNTIFRSFWSGRRTRALFI